MLSKVQRTEFVCKSLKCNDSDMLVHIVMEATFYNAHPGLRYIISHFCWVILCAQFHSIAENKS